MDCYQLNQMDSLFGSRVLVAEPDGVLAIAAENRGHKGNLIFALRVVSLVDTGSIHPKTPPF